MREMAAPSRGALAPPNTIALTDLVPEVSQPLVGGFGVVFLSRWVAQRRRVAVKVPIAVLLHGAGGADLGGVFAEAEKLKRASDGGVNDFVVRLFGVASGVASGAAWAAACDRARAALTAKGVPALPPASAAPLQLLGLVMEWHEGGSLSMSLFPPGALRAPWPFSLPDKLRVLGEVALGLTLLHESGIVHGDVKSENVLLSAAAGAERHPRLADFGFAELRAAADRASRASQISLTHELTGAIKGTWAYMAPEMQSSYDCNNGRIVPALAADRRTDVYAFGTLAWEVLVGEQPWGGFPDTDARRKAIDQGELICALAPPSAEATSSKKTLIDLPRLLPPIATNVISRCLAFDRADRPRMAEVLASLEQAHDQLAGADRRRQVFLSYCWASSKQLAIEVYRALTTEGVSVWFDENEMQHDMQKSMCDGVLRCDVVVVLMTPAYAARENCLFELRCATMAKKPVIVCIAAQKEWYKWGLAADGTGTRSVPDDHEAAQLARLAQNKWVDFGDASTVNWLAQPVVPAAERSKLTRMALPSLLQLVAAATAEAEATGSAAAPRRKPAVQTQAQASLASSVVHLAERLLLLAGEDRAAAAVATSTAAQTKTTEHLLVKQEALQSHAAAVGAAIVVLRSKAEEARSIAAAREVEATKLDAKAAGAIKTAATLVDAAKEAYAAAISKSRNGVDEPARIKWAADNVLAEQERANAEHDQETAEGLRADVAELRAAAEKAAAADSIAAAQRSALETAAGIAGADLLAAQAMAKTSEAAAIRARALDAVGFVGGIDSAAELDDAVARLKRFAQAQSVLAFAASAIPGTLPSINADSAVSKTLRAKVASLTAARDAAADLDEISARLLAESKTLHAGKALLAENAATQSNNARVVREAALVAAGFSGRTVTDVEAAIESLKRLLMAQEALAEAARAVPMAILRGVTGLVAENILHSRESILAAARSAAGKLDEEAAKLLAESTAARARAQGDGDAFLKAIAERRIEKARELAERGGAFVARFVDLGGNSALIRTLDAGLDDLAVLLIERGADVAAVEAASGKTPLDFCRLHNVPHAHALIKLKGGATVSDLHARDGAALIEACSSRDTVRALALVESGADVTLVTPNGQTALLFACEGGLDDVACALINLGADVNAIGMAGKTPLDLVSRSCCLCFVFSRAPRMLAALRSRGALTSAQILAARSIAKRSVAEINGGAAPARIVALLRNSAIDKNVCTAAANAFAKITEKGEGFSPNRRACVKAGVPAMLVALAQQTCVKSNAEAACLVARALCNLTVPDEGREACISAGAPAALVALAGLSSVKSSADAAQYVARAVRNCAVSDAGKTACVSAGAPAALVALANQPSVKGSADAAENVARAIYFFAASDTCRSACISAGAPAALVALVRQPSVKKSAEAAKFVAQSIAYCAISDAGQDACLSAGAPAAFVALASQQSVRVSSEAAQCVAQVLGKCAVNDVGREACISAGAPAALVLLAGLPSVKGSAGAARSVAWAICHCTTNNAGEAACISAGAPAALVELAGLQSVKGSADAAQFVARALGNCAASDKGKKACISAGVPAALVSLAGLTSVKSSADAAQFVAQAFANCAMSDAGKTACISAGVPAALVSLAGLPSVKDSADAVQYVAWAMRNCAVSDTGKTACICAGVPAALVSLAGLTSVRGSADAAQYVAWAIRICAVSEEGEAACISAGAPAALVILAGLSNIKGSAVAAKDIAWAISYCSVSDAGRAACVSAGAPAALVVLAGQPSVKGNADAAQYVASAMIKCAVSNAGKAVFIAAGAAEALTALKAQPNIASSAMTVSKIDATLAMLSW